MYITDPSDQIQLIKEMTQLRKDMKSYEVYYHHSYSDQMWKSFFPQAWENDLGPKLLRQEPPPESLEEQISICLTEEVPQNAIGLGIELSVEIQKWPEIFRILETGYASWHPRQVRLFLKHLKSEKFPERLERYRNGGSADEIFPEGEKTLKDFIRRSRKLKIKSYFF